MAPRHRGSIALTGLAVALASCGGIQSPPEGASATATSTDAMSPPATSSSAASDATGATLPLEPGTLVPGNRYVLEELGVAFTADADGWFVTTQSGGEAAMSREGVTVYFTVPESVTIPEGPQPAPADADAFVDLVDRTSVVQVLERTPIELGGLPGLAADLRASGSGPSHFIMTTVSGDFGLTDGDHRWLVLEVDDRIVVVSIERSPPDIAAALEAVGPLIDSLEAAP